MNIYKSVLIIILLKFSLFADSCWNVHDKANMEQLELESKIMFSFKDSVTCKPISNAKVSFFNNTYTTNHYGEIIVDIPSYDLDRKIPLYVHKGGYIDFHQKVTAAAGTYLQNKFLMSESLAIDSARFVLSWGTKPRDLDLHLRSNNFHISYRKKNGNYNQAKLDRDSKHGYGPETITLNHLKNNEKYYLYVYNYSNDKRIDNNTNISIYTNNKLDQTITLDDNTNKRCIKIATIYNNIVEYNIDGVDSSICK